MEKMDWKQKVCQIVKSEKLDQTMKTIYIVYNVLVGKLVEYRFMGGCLFSCIIFSEELRSKNIEHKVVRGYANINKNSSYRCYWIEINSVVYDAMKKASSIMGCDSVTGFDSGYTDFEYSVDLPLYNLVDENTIIKRSDKYLLEVIYDMFVEDSGSIWAKIAKLEKPPEVVKKFVIEIKYILRFSHLL